MIPGPDTRLAIDPQLCLKNDVDRVVLLTRSSPLTSRSDVCFLLHPTAAIILSLFDGERTIEGVKSLWMRLTEKPPQIGERDVDRVLELYGHYGNKNKNDSIFVEVDEKNKNEIVRYDPKDFVIPKKRVNVTDLRLRKPYIVYYLPTLFCPQKCVYCYAKTSPTPERNPINLERMREIFWELGSIGVEVISLSGGDPLARGDIYELIASMIEAGIMPDIATKVGLSFRRIQELRDLGVELIQVSLDSSDPQILDRMVGVEGYHKRAFRLMEDLRRAGMRVRVNTVLTPINIPTIGALIDYLGNLGNVQKVTLSPYGRSMFCHQDNLFIDPAHLDELSRQIAGKTELYKHMQIIKGSSYQPVSEDKKERRRQWERRAFCTANRQGFVILPDGRVTVCEELYDQPRFLIGDLRKQSVMEMWNSPKALSLIYPDQAEVPDGPCKTCKSFVECNAGRGRCWRDILKAYGWSMPHYPDPRCPLAPPAPRMG